MEIPQQFKSLVIHDFEEDVIAILTTLIHISRWCICMQVKASITSTIRGQMSLRQIALEFDFTNESHLIKYFRKYTGMNPSEFRQIKSKHLK